MLKREIKCGGIIQILYGAIKNLIHEI